MLERMRRRLSRSTTGDTASAALGLTRAGVEAPEQATSTGAARAYLT
jgi:hypothetical protein